MSPFRDPWMLRDRKIRMTKVENSTFVGGNFKGFDQFVDTVGGFSPTQFEKYALASKWMEIFPREIGVKRSPVEFGGWHLP